MRHKIVAFVISSLALLNAGEGIIHLITSCVSFWGMYDSGIWDWRIATSPTTDLFMGFISLLTAFVLGKGHIHFHGKNND